MDLFRELASGNRERCEFEHRFWRSDRSLMWRRTVMALVQDGEGRVARYGGDEFLVLTDDVESVADATQLAWRLTHSPRAPYLIDGAEFPLSASIGACYSTDQDDQPDEILRNADRAMDIAERQGRNRVEVFGEEPAGEAAA